jgi:DNA-binding PadR family transcriptional regulator
MAKKNTAEYALLGLLSSSPASGYDLHRRSEELIGHFWSESFASIYPMLKRLMQKKWVDRIQVEQNDKPDKWIYSLTDLGIVALKEWLREPLRMPPPRNLVLLKLYFGHLTKRDILRRHVENYRNELLDELHEIEQKIARIKNSASASNDIMYSLLTLSHSIHVTKANLAWCKNTLEFIEQQELGRI